MQMAEMLLLKVYPLTFISAQIYFSEAINTVRLNDVTDNTSFRINGAYKLVAMAMYSSNSRRLPGMTFCP